MQHRIRELYAFVHLPSTIEFDTFNEPAIAVVVIPSVEESRAVQLDMLEELQQERGLERQLSIVPGM